MRRYRTVPGDFDTRCCFLEPPGVGWEEEVRTLHIASQTRIIAGLKHEFGAQDFDRKVADFTAIGVKPFSVQTYHNSFFDQIRRAFVQGAYYPALVGACALGERILNHLVLDLRDDYAHTPEHETIATQKTLSSWTQMVSALKAWGVIDSEVYNLFRTLARLRHRSIHFNPETYQNTRDDALRAIETLRDILDGQFAAFGPQRWYIPGTLGACFVAKAYEHNPFVRKFIVPSSAYVGPLHNMKVGPDGEWQFVDWPPETYGVDELTDEEFKDMFNSRSPESLVPVNDA